MMRLDLPESLERVLSSTNLIENLFSRVRDTACRVKRWQGCRGGPRRHHPGNVRCDVGIE